jgi:D-glycero-alpha-D-manno-heptose-7-phosphate kinase
MIISRTPLRISFSGGGSDLSGFYGQEQGAVLSTSIDKYVYLTLHKFFNPDKIQLKYSKAELVSDYNEINHPIFRECLKLFNIKGVDINSIADVPAGTGLGSSSSFTVGLLHILNAYQGRYVSQEYLATNACDIEINHLGEPIGKQDQYAAAYGGLNFITFQSDESVKVEKIIMRSDVKQQLEESLVMMYTGDTHSANVLLEQQRQAMNHKNKRAVQREMVRYAFELKRTLENDHIDDFGRILHEGWLLKKSLTSSISTSLVDDLYQRGLDAGALGGKLLGAGGGGFILFYCPLEKQDNLRNRMGDIRELRFRFDADGSKIIYVVE